MSQKLFNKFTKETKDLLPKGKSFSNKGREQYPFAKLEWIGLDKFAQLKKEYQLMKKGKSKRPRSERRAILQAYHRIHLFKIATKVK